MKASGGVQLRGRKFRHSGMAAVVTCGAAFAMQAPTALAEPAVVVVSSSMWGPEPYSSPQSLQEYHVVGEVKNGGPGIASDIRIDIELYDSSGNDLGTAATDATVGDLFPGETSPFELITVRGEDVGSYKVKSVEVTAAPSPPDHDFTTTVTSVTEGSGVNTDYQGTVTNNGSQQAIYANVVASFYNASGALVATEWTYPDGYSEGNYLNPGQTKTFTISLPTSEPYFPKYTSYQVMAQSPAPPYPSSSSPPPTYPKCSGTLPSGTVVGMATTADGDGYWIASSTGEVVACGDAPSFGNGPTDVTGIATDRYGDGYLLVTASGMVEAFGTAAFHGDLTGTALAKPIVDITQDPATGGYWLLGGDGGVFSFDAPFFGSTGNIRLAKPAVGMQSTPDGGGYLFVASDGGVFTYGDAHFYGSMGGRRLNKPVVGMSDDPATGGYWLDASDGGIFSFHAPFYGSTGNIHLNQPCVGMTSMPDGSGYRLVAADGGIFNFSAPFEGSAA